MANTYLTRTPSSTGNATKWTLSMWVKRSKLGVQTPIISTVQSSPSNTYDEMYFNTSDKFQFSTVYNNTQKAIRTTRVFRDVNAWYHIQFVYDTTNSTDTDHAILYINGVRETSFEDTTLLASGANDFESAWNKASNPMRIGYQSTNTASYFDGSMSHIHFANNQTYAATVFGETDATTGEWKIKTSPSFTPGTNGFTILKDGNTITDQSTNSNNFSLGGGTLTKTEDCPDNVFATWNPLVNNAGEMMRLTNGNTSCQSNAAEGNSWKLAVSTLGMTSGKYYWEAKLVNINNNNYHGVMGSNVFQANASLPMNATGFTGWNNSDGGEILKDGDNTANNYGTLADNDILGIACDVDNYTISVYKNGSALVSNYALSTTGRDILFPCSLAYNTNNTGIPQSSYNFGNGYFGSTQISSAGTNASGNGIFEYNVPAGFTALSTKGLNL